MMPAPRDLRVRMTLTALLAVLSAVPLDAGSPRKNLRVPHSAGPSRLILRFLDPAGTAHYGLLQDGRVVEVRGGVEEFMQGTFERTGRSFDRSAIRLLPPVVPSKIVAFGWTYSAHAREVGGEVGRKEPLVFLKPPTVLIGDGDTIRYPAALTSRVEYEGELAVIIGRRAKGISPEQAAECILGYTCMNDVTARDLTAKDPEYTRGKGFDTFGPLGPWIATGIDGGNLRLLTRVNGETKQNARTSEMIYSIPFLISFISQVMTLNPGDVIATGTPGGSAPMRPGDLVEVEIEGIGILRNFLQSTSGDAQERPLTLARRIAERVIRETPLELRVVPNKPLPGLHVLDFGPVFGSHPTAAAYATSAVQCSRDTLIRFGVSADCPVRIFVNGAPVFESSGSRAFRFHETGYDLYEFSDSMTVPLRQGENALLVKAVPGRGRNVVLLRELSPPKTTPAATFVPRSAPVQAGADPWMYSEGDDKNWRTAPRTYVSELAIDPNAVYSRESYAEWMYPSGTVLLSMLQLSAATGDTAYKQFVRRVCNFTAKHVPLFSRQYHEQHAFRGTNYRIFRRSMLDDTGAPVLPYIEVQRESRSAWMDSLVNWMAAYVTSGQVRLPDGTFCRYEHRPFTVWGDDLFMSVPFLVRLGRGTGEARYFDDAARQILNFHRYLSDQGTGLYHHAFYHFSGRRSPVLWGRANGWIVWAHTEALKHLPKGHPSYTEIAGLFRRHLDAVIRVQGRAGLWHQILDDPGSFEETSCTAMFMIGMARGMSLGILGEEYRIPLRKALEGLRSRISCDGIVRDITRGTEVSDDPAYYRTRERYPNDPRGLGAVITALIETEAAPGLLEPPDRNRTGEPR